MNPGTHSVRIRSLVLAAGIVAAGCVWVPSALAQAQTGFTYQGQLKDAGVPLNGLVDVRFVPFPAPSSGNALAAPVTRSNVPVTNGLFSTTVDFGAGPFATNQPVWMEIDIASPAGSGQFVGIGTRQLLTPTPYSIATRGINVDGAGNIAIAGNIAGAADMSFTSELNHSIAVLDRLNPGDGGRSLTIRAGSVSTGRTPYVASGGGDLILQAGNGFNQSTNFTGGNTIIRSGSNWIASNGGTYDGGGIFLQTGGPTNTFIDRMMITRSGDIGIGTTTPAARLDVVGGSIQVQSGAQIRFGSSSEGSDPVWFRRRNRGDNQTDLELRIGDDPGTGPGAADNFIITTGDSTTLFQFTTQATSGQPAQALKPGGGSWGVLSDARAKHDIQPLCGALDRLLQLPGHTYLYNDPHMTGAAPGPQIGFVAQEVETVFPQWIGEANGLKTVSVTGFEALTVESLRELRDEAHARTQALNAELEARNAQLEARIARLEALIAASQPAQSK